MRTVILQAFKAEGERLSEVLRGLHPNDLVRPTPCRPWNVAELTAHVITATVRPVEMLAQPEPATIDTDAVGYYRPEIFEPAKDAGRVEDARRQAAEFTDGLELAAAFAAALRKACAAVGAARPDQRIRTRHGDGMLLDEFMITRVVELALHGLDLAVALERDPWTTAEAAAVTERLLLTAEGSAGRPKLDWDQATFIAKATGRAALTPEESQRVRDLQISWIQLS